MADTVQCTVVLMVKKTVTAPAPCKGHWGRLWSYGATIVVAEIRPEDRVGKEMGHFLLLRGRYYKRLPRGGDT